MASKSALTLSLTIVLSLYSAQVCQAENLSTIKRGSNFVGGSVRSFHVIDYTTDHQQFERAKILLDSGEVEDAINTMRPSVSDSAISNIFMGLLIARWRDRLAMAGKRSLPTTDWYMDWWRCGAIQQNGETNDPPPYAADLLADAYSRDFSVVKSDSGGEVLVPGPGKSPKLESCWQQVAESELDEEKCLNLELNRSIEFKKRELICPPVEPSETSLRAYLHPDP